MRYRLLGTTAVVGALASACSSAEHGPAASGGAGGSAGGAAGAGGIAAAAGTDDAGERTGVTPAPEGAPYTTLAEWNLFTSAADQQPNDRVVPYSVNSPLFSDYAAKHRFMYVPEGATIGYEPEERWRFPVGTILVKTFAYPEDLRDPGSPERLLETRLLVHEADKWVPITYVWNEEQTEAVKKVAGDTIDATFVDEQGEVVNNAYTVPNSNECLDCHGEVTDTLGGRTRQLHRMGEYDGLSVNQIDHLAELGLLDVDPEPAADRQVLTDPSGSAPIEDRVRAYFDANCGHCHMPGTTADSGSGLWLDYASTDPAVRTDGSLGICKVPTSAGGATCGRTFDIVPGDPDASILMCRVESGDREVMMPPLGRNLAHAQGIELFRTWITGLQGTCQP